MEESEKRKERLKAMRMEAARADSSNDATVLSPGVCLLENPLVDTSTPLSVPDEPRAGPRFDYYTDPMAAFSGNKRGSHGGNQTPGRYFNSRGPRNFEGSPSPSHQWQPNYTPHNRPYQAHAPWLGFSPHQSPRGMGTSPEPWNASSPRGSYFQTPNSSRGGNLNGLGFQPLGRPDFNQTVGSPQWRGFNPGPAAGIGGSADLSSGRGRGKWFGSSPRSGRGGGRVLGFNAPGSTSYRSCGPERFYDRSMLEDPWVDLVPVIWKGVDKSGNNLSNTAGSSESWMPDSIRTKKQRYAEATNQSTRGFNLAEFLTASFNEATTESSDT